MSKKPDNPRDIELREVNLDSFPDCCLVCKYYLGDGESLCCQLLGNDKYDYDKYNYMAEGYNVCDYFERV